MNEIKYCECGCGEVVTNRFKKGHWIIMNNPNKGKFNFCVRSDYRTRLFWNKYHPDDPMPQRGYVIHHKDEDCGNEREDNLEKVTRSEHGKIHIGGEKNPAKRKEVKKKISSAMKGRALTKEHKRKISDAHQKRRGDHVLYRNRPRKAGSCCDDPAKG